MFSTNSHANPLFVWRYSDKWDYNSRNVRTCIYCKTELVKETIPTDEPSSQQGFITNRCPACGWAHGFKWVDDDGETFYDMYASFLRSFSLNDAEVTLAEIGAHLRKNFKSIYDISPRRFEQLVADIYRNLGYKVILTKATRDGGYDLILFDKDGRKTLVEIKRWKHKVDVAQIRQLRGVQLREDNDTAILVSAGRFTGDARREASLPNRPNYALSLVDADDLLRYLDVYSGVSTVPKWTGFVRARASR